MNSGGGQTAKNESGWSVDTLKEHLESMLTAADMRYEQRFLAQEKAVHEALGAAEKAVAVAERNAEQWRAGANEWRGSMTDRERDFARKTDLESLKERVDKTEGGGQGKRDMWGWVSAGVILLIAVIGFFYRLKT